MEAEPWPWPWRGGEGREKLGGISDKKEIGGLKWKEKIIRLKIANANGGP
jgi:hypothetical protein